MKKLIYIFLVGIIFSTILSCKKTNDLTFGEGEYAYTFPNSVGTFWKYKVYDSFERRLDTVTISVVAHDKFDDGTVVNIWAYKYKYKLADTNYVSIINNEVRIYPYGSLSLNNRFYIKHYILPIALDKIWPNLNIADTSKVIQKQNISVIAGNFIDALCIQRNFKTFPGFNNTVETEWFIPEIGIILRDYRNTQSGSLPQIEHWELLNYHIN